MADNAAAAPANEAGIDSDKSIIPFALTPAICNEPVNLPDQWGVMISTKMLSPPCPGRPSTILMHCTFPFSCSGEVGYLWVKDDDEVGVEAPIE
jgi:hypothetical protein